MEKLLSVKEASGRLGLSLWTVYRWARSGRVASIQLGRRRLFSEEDLRALVIHARSNSSVRDENDDAQTSKH